MLASALKQQLANAANPDAPAEVKLDGQGREVTTVRTGYGTTDIILPRNVKSGFFYYDEGSTKLAERFPPPPRTYCQLSGWRPPPPVQDDVDADISALTAEEKEELARIREADAAKDLDREWLALGSGTTMRNSKTYVLTRFLEDRGWRLDTSGGQCNLLWLQISLSKVKECDFPVHGFRVVNEGNCISRFPLMAEEINQKENFARNIRNMQLQFGREGWEFHPETFFVDEESERERLMAESIEKGDEGLWIFKPTYGGCGIGIFTHQGPVTKDLFPPEGQWIVQRYIHNPYLADGYKFTMRMYLLVTSVNPLRAYLYRNGVCKFCTQKFEVTPGFFAPENARMHITNQHVNAGAGNFVVSPDPMVDDVGSRRSVKAMFKHFETSGLDAKVSWEMAKDHMVKTVLCAEDKITRACEGVNANMFQLFGMDVDPDETGKPWIIEANVNAGLDTSAAFDLVNKDKMMGEYLDMVGLAAFDVPAYKNDLLSRIQAAMEYDVQETVATAPTLAPGTSISTADLRVLVDFEYEDTFCGDFEIIYPAMGTVDAYQQYFAEERPTNIVLARWVKMRDAHKHKWLD